MNNYRVDINYTKRVPCGMNSIYYMGDSLILAKRHLMYLQLSEGKHFGKRVICGCLSKWDELKRDFVIIDSFNHEV